MKIELETTSPNSKKVLAFTIMKKCGVEFSEVEKTAKEIGINIKNQQSVLDVADAQKIAEIIYLKKQKLNFEPEKYKRYSTIDNYINIVDFIDYTLEVLKKQIQKNNKTLKTANNSYRELLALNFGNEELKKIKSYLLSKFDFSLENLVQKLLVMKTQALEYIDEVKNSCDIFKDFEFADKKIDFNFTAKKIALLYEEQVNKINNFSTYEKFFKEIIKELKKLQKADERFRTIDKEKLLESLKDYLEDDFEKIYFEWEKEINKLNKLYYKIIQGYFVGKITFETLIALFEIILEINDKIEEFYLSIRSGISAKYKDNPKSALLEEVDVKARIFKIYQDFQEKFVKLLKENSYVSNLFINEILSDLIDFKIKKAEEFGDIYNKFFELHSKNLQIYLNDIKTYAKELEKRDLEISKLLYKMQKDLERMK